MAQNIDEIVLEAERLVDLDHLSKAINLLTSIPSNEQTINSLNCLYYAHYYAKNYEMCLKIAQQMLECEPENLWAINKRNEALLKHGQLEAALEGAEIALQIARSKTGTTPFELQYTLMSLWRVLTELHEHAHALAFAREGYSDAESGWEWQWELNRSLTATGRITEMTVLYGYSVESYLRGLQDAVFDLVFLERYEQAAALSLEGIPYTSVTQPPKSKPEKSVHEFLIFHIECLILSKAYDKARRLIAYWQADPRTPRDLHNKLLALQLSSLYASGYKNAALELLKKYIGTTKQPLRRFKVLRYLLTWEPTMEIMNSAFLELYPGTKPKLLELH